MVYFLIVFIWFFFFLPLSLLFWDPPQVHFSHILLQGITHNFVKTLWLIPTPRSSWVIFLGTAFSLDRFFHVWLFFILCWALWTMCCPDSGFISLPQRSIDSLSSRQLIWLDSNSEFCLSWDGQHLKSLLSSLTSQLCFLLGSFESPCTCPIQGSSEDSVKVYIQIWGSFLSGALRSEISTLTF